MDLLTIIQGDCREALKALPDESVHACVTSPPYFGLRDYGVSGQIGLEPSPDEYVSAMVEVFREVKRVLRPDGTLWLNLGDTYASNGATGGRDKSILQSQMPPIGTTPVCRSVPVDLKVKDLIGIPWRVAFALQADGWYLRSDIIWSKPNPMPESVTDRPTKAHEYIFLLSKSERYYYDSDAIKEETVWPIGSRLDQKQGEFNGKRAGSGLHDSFRAIREMRNKRSVWTIPTLPYSGAHFATFPPDLIRPCILAGCSVGGVVLDPFAGSGTTGKVALELGRKAILIELNPEYIKLIERRCTTTLGLPFPSSEMDLIEVEG